MKEHFAIFTIGLFALILALYFGMKAVFPHWGFGSEYG